MPIFNETVIRQKFDKHLQNSEFKILKWFFIHHKRHFKLIARVWYEEISAADTKRKILFMQFAHDLIQAGHKMGLYQLEEEFTAYLFRAFELVEQNIKVKNDLIKMLHHWEDRGLYKSEIITIKMDLLNLNSECGNFIL